MANPRAKYTLAEKLEFSRKLKRFMREQGISNSELARLASKHVPKAIARQNVSSWVSAINIPEEQNLLAVEKALKLPQGLLLARSHATAPGEPDEIVERPAQDVQTSLRPGGKMEMRMVVTVLRKTGRAIQLLLDQDAGEDVAPSPPERPPKSLE